MQDIYTAAGCKDRNYKVRFCGKCSIPIETNKLLGCGESVNPLETLLAQRPASLILIIYQQYCFVLRIGLRNCSNWADLTSQIDPNVADKFNDIVVFKQIKGIKTSQISIKVL